jgi:hypothetical protein
MLRDFSRNIPYLGIYQVFPFYKEQESKAILVGKMEFPTLFPVFRIRVTLLQYTNIEFFF